MSIISTNIPNWEMLYTATRVTNTRVPLESKLLEYISVYVTCISSSESLWTFSSSKPTYNIEKEVISQTIKMNKVAALLKKMTR